MFKDKYKQEMDNIKPSDEAINKALALNNFPQKNNKRILRTAIACILTVALICTFTIGAFMLSGYKSANDNSSNVNSSVANDAPVKLTGIRQAKSYSELKSVLKDYEDTRYPAPGFPNFEIDEFGGSTDGMLDAPEVMEPTIKDENDTDHSDTNNQVSGVQESDIVKNDGKYIYYYNADKQKIYIIEAGNGNPKQISEIDMSESSVIGMMLLDDTLAVICDKNQNTSYENGDYYTTHKELTYCDYYDITDKSDPELKFSMSQEGWYVDSRAVGNIVYVITKHYASNYDNDDFIPECGGVIMDPECIYIPDHINSSAFTVITAFDATSNKESFKSTLSILGGASTVYSGKENLYFTENSPMKDDISGLVPSSNTAIYRIALNNGNLTLNGSGCVPGTINNQFNIDESGDILRIATNIQFCEITDDVTVSFSTENTVNRIFCLDENLEIIGESDDLGKTEQIKSVRYIGDIAYVVTFRQTDPLYAIDLSDPENPKVLSELKIEGFSTYMHPYGENYIIGIGFDADPETGITTGLKVTVFDISNPNDIFDVSSYIITWDYAIGGSYYDTEAAYNHKALLIDYKKGIIAIPLFETYHGEYYEASKITTSFVFLDFDGSKLTEAAKTIISEYSFDDYYYSSARGLYIGEHGYVIDNNCLISVSLATMEKISTLNFE